MSSYRRGQFSYYQVIFADVELLIKNRGIKLYKEGLAEVMRPYNNGCHAVVKDGESIYPVFIGFHRIGSSNQICTCIVFSHDLICEHIVATALEYDHNRGVDTEWLLTLESVCTLQGSSLQSRSRG